MRDFAPVRTAVEPLTIEPGVAAFEAFVPVSSFTSLTTLATLAAFFLRLLVFD